MTKKKCECNGRTYSLTETGHILCLECAKQYPISEEEE